jgi:hypothetical protein
MGIFSRMRKGYRWSVYFCKNGKQTEYVLHGSDVTSMHAAIPLSTRQLNEGWSVWLNLNRKHTRDGVDRSFQLLPTHFGKNLPTESFFRELEKIDPEWSDNRRTHPTEMFMDKHRKEIPMLDPLKKKMFDGDIDSIVRYVDPSFKTKQVRDYWDVLDEIFASKMSAVV